ncbi:hypothetical protein LTR37_012955 [Vermiconidia calcicola]|uniref:Uncharacterized protein n=1 Tax=Vermiconidia calcicola TaxID=1690605 RepID=A0ACC3MY88_9PEZI|nr:hypothetical protein LTR37_012955 [Vermiconidia calcicola]
MPATHPNPRSWTLRFKHNRNTFLLHIDPLQTLSSVKHELLKAVQQTHPNGTLNGNTIPQNPDEILLARPIDINDLSAGWESIEPRSGDVDGDTGASGKGKGKATTPGKSTSAGAKLKDCPHGAGLRDGGVVAFKFKVQRDEEREKAEQNGDFIVAVEDEEVADEEWDVVVPSVEETNCNNIRKCALSSSPENPPPKCSASTLVRGVQVPYLVRHTSLNRQRTGELRRPNPVLAVLSDTARRIYKYLLAGALLLAVTIPPSPMTEPNISDTKIVELLEPPYL